MPHSFQLQLSLAHQLVPRAHPSLLQKSQLALALPDDKSLALLQMISHLREELRVWSAHWRATWSPEEHFENSPQRWNHHEGSVICHHRVPPRFPLLFHNLLYFFPQVVKPCKHFSITQPLHLTAVHRISRADSSSAMDAVNASALRLWWRQSLLVNDIEAYN